MAGKEQLERRSEIISPKQRLKEDPRGLHRYTIFGDFVFRDIGLPKPIDEVELKNFLDNDIFEQQVEEEGE